MQNKEWGILALGLTAVWLLLWWLCVPAHNVQVLYTKPSADPSDTYPLFPSQKPWMRAQAGEVATYRVTLRLNQPWQMQHFRLLPDDCIVGLALNGRVLEADRLPLCNYGGGENLALAGLLQPGENTLLIAVRNNQSILGLDFYVNPMADSTGHALLILGSFCLLLWLWLGCRLFQLPPAAAVAFLLINGLILFGGFHFTYRAFAHDLGAHLDHIAHLYIRWWREDPFAHAGFRYPSTIHLLQALFLKATEPLLVGGLALRVFSYLCYVGFLLAGARLIAWSLPGKPRVALLLQMLFLLWPLHAIVALRVSNDIPFYLAVTLAFWLWMLLQRSPGFHYLAAALMASAFAMLVKYNAIVLLPAALWVLWSIRREVGILLLQASQHRLLAVATVLVMGGALYLGPIYSLLKAAELPYNPGILGAHGHGGAGLFGRNDAAAIGLPSATQLFDDPFVDLGNLEARQNLWEYMLKSALFGEFRFAPEVATARWMLCGLLLMLLSLLPWLFCLERDFPRKEPQLWLHLLFLCASVLALAGFRLLYQQTAAMDFRYIVPCLVSFVVVWQHSVAFWWRRNLLLLPVLSVFGALLVICGGFFYYSAYFMALT